MRPTLLNFRSPKEKTPCCLDPKVTYDGRFLSFNSPKGNGKTSTFSTERRFAWYKELKGTEGPGPGRYTPLCPRDGKTRIRCGSPYHKLYGLKNDSYSNHFMVGDQLVHDVDSLLYKHSPSSYSSLKSSKKNIDFAKTNHTIRKCTPEPYRKENFMKQAKLKKDLVVNYEGKGNNLFKIESILKKRFRGAKYFN